MIDLVRFVFKGQRMIYDELRGTSLPIAFRVIARLESLPAF